MTRSPYAALSLFLYLNSMVFAVGGLIAWGGDHIAKALILAVAATLCWVSGRLYARKA